MVKSTNWLDKPRIGLYWVVSTPSVVYNWHLKFQTSVSIRIPLYGSRNLAYVACKMDYMRPF